MNHRLAMLGAMILFGAPALGEAADMIAPVRDRYSPAEVKEVPDFQRHVLPLMGRLGCNTRSCHGSFQGRGDFRLSLFGYDFKMDHDALHKKDAQRVVTDNPEASKILQKPTLEIPHKGGKRLDAESWQYRLLVRWIEAGAKGAENQSRIERLEVIPAEIVAKNAGETTQLQVIAHWSDGGREDVTCITRYRTNDESIAEINEDGLVTIKGKGDTHVVAFYDNGVAVTPVILPVSDKVGSSYPSVSTSTKVDGLVVEKLRKLGIVPATLCTDEEFLRRVSLDMTGTLPSPSEVTAFQADKSANKRTAKVDELLSRPTYAAWWTNKLCDYTGNTPRTLNLQQAVPVEPSKFWYEWIYRRVNENVPYDQLVAGIVVATSRKDGQSYEEYVAQETAYYRDKNPADFTERETMPYFWARRNLQQVDDKALGFSYAFLGVRLECAQCHKHPFDQWTQDDFKQFTAFFRSIGYGASGDKEGRDAAKKLRVELGIDKPMTADLRRRIRALIKEGKVTPWPEVYVAANGAEVRRGKKANVTKTGRVVTPKLLGGDVVDVAKSKDPREPLMDWMRDKDNPYFARAFVNRVWFNYFGKGIVNPPDDSNLANPPSNAALLTYLSDGFIAHNFDMKWLHREIANSDTYQRSWHTNDTNSLDERNFSHSQVRRIPAEVIVDAISQATASSTGLAHVTTAVDQRSMGALATAGMKRRNGAEHAGKVFGRATRETNCDCSRSDDPNLLQSLYMQNDTDIYSAIDRRDGWLSESAGAVVKARSDQGRSAPVTPEAIARVTERLVEVEKRIGELDKNNLTKAERLIKQREGLRSEVAQLSRKVDEQKKGSGAAAFSVDKTVVEAYLRTLSRLPNADERTLASQHFAGASDEAQGLRDLLWALLNTKEFITNH